MTDINRKYWYLVSYSVPTPQGQCLGHMEIGMSGKWSRGTALNVVEKISMDEGFHDTPSIIAVFDISDS